MSSVVNVAIHPSQFPDQVRLDLVASLRSGKVNHKFHYDSVKQTQKWLSLHQAYSPSRTDDDCKSTYDSAFAGAVKRLNSTSIHLIGLGCGGGQKDTRLLQSLKQSGKRVAYTPSDVSLAMVLVARETALGVITPHECHPLVCDLASANDLAQVLDEQVREGYARLITFFGMIPNFEPSMILPKLAGLLHRDDWLLFSANLAPGDDYIAGVQHILPLYDNEPTREWLITFLLDLGVDRNDGKLKFTIEDDPNGSGLKRVAAYFHFVAERELAVEQERFSFKVGDAIRLFFSYRHTLQRVKSLLHQNDIDVVEQWVTKSDEEGVFLCRRR
jgi:L-histidine N-alpha-methyltransferase